MICLQFLGKRKLVRRSEFFRFVPRADQVRRSKKLAYWEAFPTSTIRGTRIVKIEPRPGSLATVMSPPII